MLRNEYEITLPPTLLLKDGELITREGVTIVTIPNMFLCHVAHEYTLTADHYTLSNADVTEKYACDADYQAYLYWLW